MNPLKTLLAITALCVGLNAQAGQMRMNYFAKTVAVPAGTINPLKVGNVGLIVPASEGAGRILVELQVAPESISNGDVTCTLHDLGNKYSITTTAPMISPLNGSHETVGSQNSPVPSPLATTEVTVTSGALLLSEIDCTHRYGMTYDSFHIVAKMTFVPNN